MPMVRIVEITSRYGEQASGVGFSKKAKIAIAVLLDQVGVYAVEAGAQFACTTVLGLGKRDGNCALETIALVFDQFLPTSIAVNENTLTDMVHYVIAATSVPKDRLTTALALRSQ